MQHPKIGVDEDIATRPNILKYGFWGNKPCFGRHQNMEAGELKRMEAGEGQQRGVVALNVGHQ